MENILDLEDVDHDTNSSLIANSNQSDLEGGLDVTSVQRTQAMPLIESDRTIATIYIAIMVVALVIGAFGNTMIIIVTTCVSSIRRTGSQFIINLALADLCVSGIADPMCVIAVVKGEAFFNDKPGLCDTIAAMCLTACLCAFLSLTLASFNRYVFVCHNMIYDRIFNKWTICLMCMGAWLVAFLFEFPNFIGWGDHSFDKKSHQCIWDRTASLSYTLLVSVGLVGFPLFTMGLFFLAIFRKIYSTKLNLYSMECDGIQSSMKAWAETVKSSKMLFVIFVIFVLLWTPYGLVVSIDTMDKMPVKAHLFVTMLAHLHSSANFIVYIICNRQFRHACMRILHIQKCIRTQAMYSDNRITSPKVTSITGTNIQSKGVEKVSSNSSGYEG